MPVEGSAIAADFLILGLRVKNILPTGVYAEPAVDSDSSQPEPASQPIESIEPPPAEPSGLTKNSEPSGLMEDNEPPSFVSAEWDELASEDTDIESSDSDEAEIEASVSESDDPIETKPEVDSE